MTKKLIVILSLALAGCVSSTQHPPAPEVQSSVIVPNSMIQLADKMSAMRKITLTNGEEHQLWFSYDCANTKIWSLYRDRYQNGEFKERHYGNSINSYTPPQLIGGGPNNPQQETDIAAICQFNTQAADWVKISGAKSTEYDLLLDVKNSSRKGEMLLARLGYQYHNTQYAAPFNAPYTQKIENHLFNCKTQEDSITATLDVNAENLITNASLTDKANFTQGDNGQIPRKQLIALCKVKDISGYKG